MRSGTNSGELQGKALLAILAHPDDESIACGGLLAACADRGAIVSLLCLTAGEHGPGHSNAGGLGTVREAELTAAAKALGIANVLMLAHEDGMLPWIDRDHLEADIGNAIDRLHPDVVITFDEDGLYWHPDHIAVHDRVTSVVSALGSEAPSLYYVTIPPGAMRTVFDTGVRLAAERGTPPPQSILGIQNPDAYGAAAPEPTLVIDLGEFATQKLSAIRCHRSQLQDDALGMIRADEADALLGVEQYRRAPLSSRGDGFIERFRRASL